MNAEKKLQKREYDLARNRLLKELEIDKGKVYRKYTRLNIKNINTTKPENNQQPFVSNDIEPVIVKPKTKALDEYTPEEQIQLSYIRMNYGESYYQQVIDSYNG